MNSQAFTKIMEAIGSNDFPAITFDSVVDGPNGTEARAQCGEMLICTNVGSEDFVAFRQFMTDITLQMETPEHNLCPRTNYQELKYAELAALCLKVRGKAKPTLFLEDGPRMVFRPKTRTKRPYFVVDPAVFDEIQLFL